MIELEAEQEQANPNGDIHWIETENANALRSLIFGSQDRPEELVKVREWGTTVLMRAMSGTALARYESLREPDTGRIPHREGFAEVVIACTFHPIEKIRVFKQVDRDELMDQKNGTVIARLASIALRLSGLLATQNETTRKNLKATPDSTTSSDSQKEQATQDTLTNS